jgi:GNAT superfamily N-acetyltransferase
MMNDVTLRLADMQDLEALCRLYVEFHEFHVRGVPARLMSLGEPDAYDCSEMYPKLEKIINNEDSAIFLAEVSGQPVGLAEVYVREDQPDPARVSRKYGHLQSLMVQEEFRRHGAGGRLLEAAEKWGKERGATELRLDTWEFAEGPLEFYEHRGYRTLRRTLVREL